MWLASCIANYEIQSWVGSVAVSRALKAIDDIHEGGTTIANTAEIIESSRYEYEHFWELYWSKRRRHQENDLDEIIPNSP